MKTGIELIAQLESLLRHYPGCENKFMYKKVKEQIAKLKGSKQLTLF